MKNVSSRRHDRYEITLPVRGGFRVQFEGGRATVPDDVAEVLMGIGGGFYTLLGPNLALLEAGRQVLVIRDMGLGDLLLITPLLRALAARGVCVDVQTFARYQCLFEANPAVRRTFSLESDNADRDRYDGVLDLRLFVENEESAGIQRHRVDGFASAGDVTIGEAAEERKLDYFPTAAELKKAASRLRKLKSPKKSGIIAYVWRASAENRTWSQATHEKMIDAIQLAGWSVAVLDHEHQPYCPYGKGLVDLTGCLSIRETAAVIASCDVLLTPDTGLFHLGGALDVPTVAYFGAFPAAERAAHQNLTVLSNASACGLLPCRSYRCLNREADSQARCLSVSPWEVVAALKKATKESSKKETV